MFARKKYMTTKSTPRLWWAWLVLLGGSALAGALTGFARRYFDFNDTWVFASSLAILLTIFNLLFFEKVPDTEKEIDGRKGSE